jgi:hypothetical protein
VSIDHRLRSIARQPLPPIDPVALAHVSILTPGGLPRPGRYYIQDLLKLPTAVNNNRHWVE